MAFSLLLRAMLNFVGVAMLLPVLALVLNPHSTEGGGIIARIYTFLGFSSPRHFALTVCATVVLVIVVKSLLALWLARFERNYIYSLYSTLSRRLFTTYHARGLSFIKGKWIEVDHEKLDAAGQTHRHLRLFFAGHGF